MIGFSGGVPSGLQIHPDKEHMIYPVGCILVIHSLKSQKQEFLSQHSDIITCIAISKSGKYLASGQATHMGFKTDILVWDFKTRKHVATLKLHKVKVEALSFSPNDKYLASLGGKDDGSVVIWDLNAGATPMEAICGAPAQVQSAGETKALAFSNTRDDLFVTGGRDTLRVWELDRANRKIRPTEVSVGNLKRNVICLEFNEDDSYILCGTTTGDIMSVNCKSRYFQALGPEKQKFSLGVTSLTHLKTGQILVGAGDGTVTVVGGMAQKFKRTNKCTKVSGKVTSLALRGNGQQFYVGTEQSQIYRFNMVDFKEELLSTCHYTPVNDSCFPQSSSRLFLTCSYQDIRIWDLEDNKELLRITVPNMTCNAVDITKDGETIITGWDDGTIRAYTPESGSLKYQINDAHGGGVASLAVFEDGMGIISGGQEGRIRIWRISKGLDSKCKSVFITNLVANLSEHKARVTSIKIRPDGKECVSSSEDGTCITWDLLNMKRGQMIRVNTLFRCVSYHPGEHQFVTTGTDRKLAYWETFDGSLIRELEGSVSGSINTLDISRDGVIIVTGGDDKLVKVILYDEGEEKYIGIGHGAPVKRVKISCDKKYIISSSADGAIIKWKMPTELQYTQTKE